MVEAFVNAILLVTLAKVWEGSGSVAHLERSGAEPEPSHTLARVTRRIAFVNAILLVTLAKVWEGSGTAPDRSKCATVRVECSPDTQSVISGRRHNVEFAKLGLS